MYGLEGLNIIDGAVGDAHGAIQQSTQPQPQASFHRVNSQRAGAPKSSERNWIKKTKKGNPLPLDAASILPLQKGWKMGGGISQDTTE